MVKKNKNKNKNKSNKIGKSREKSEFEDKSVKPALDKLDKDQDELIDKFYAGFSSKTELLTWIPKLSSRTLGIIRNNILKGMVFEEPFLEDLLGVSENAIEQREKFIAKFIIPACNLSYERIRDRARDYMENREKDEKDVPKVEKQKHIAMRPRINELEQRQVESIKTGLIGFNSKQNLLKWGKSLTSASNAQINRNFAKKIYFEKPIRDAFLGENNEKNIYIRQSVCGSEIIPSFNTAIRDVSQKAGEFDEEVKEQVEPGELY